MIEVQNLVKSYQGKEATKNAVNEISFQIPRGTLYSFLGPSGCGKSTTIRMIAGLEKPTSGRIVIDNETVFSNEDKINIPVEKRPIAIVFQSYAIWPHMNVFENVSFPLKMMRPKLNSAEIKERTEHALEIVGLRDFANRASTALSGGQQQRVALARAIIKEPKVLLLDEPLSNLDARLRERMREQIMEIQQQTHVTCIFVTHDQSEALAISDRILVLNEGKIVEDGTPTEIYQKPRSHFTAKFIGIPNILNGIAENVINHHEALISTDIGKFMCRSEDSLEKGDQVRIFIRPESFELNQAESANSIEGKVFLSIFQGDYWEYRIRVNDNAIVARSYAGSQIFRKDDRIFLAPKLQEFIVRKDQESPEKYRASQTG